MRNRLRAAAAAAALFALALAGCNGSVPGSRAATADRAQANGPQSQAPAAVEKSVPPAPVAASPSAKTSSSATASAPASELPDLSGTLVMLDPGHGVMGSGSSRAIPTGRGSGTKPCQASGTQTAGGYLERDFTLDTAKRTRALLEEAGAEVVMTHESEDDNPCADERGKMAGEKNVDAWVSIHGDGSTNTSLKGFFAIVSSPPLNDAQGAPSLKLAKALIASLSDAGFPKNLSYSGALSKRDDLAGLNYLTRPGVMMELGEMKNPGEAKIMSSKQGRQRYAQAVAEGIAAYLTSR